MVRVDSSPVDGRGYEYLIVGRDETQIALEPYVWEKVIEVVRDDGERRYFIYSGRSDEDALNMAMRVPWDALKDTVR